MYVEFAAEAIAMRKILLLPQHCATPK